MVTVWFGVGQFLSGAMGQLYHGGDKLSNTKDIKSFTTDYRKGLLLTAFLITKNIILKMEHTKKYLLYKSGITNEYLGTTC